MYRRCWNPTDYIRIFGTEFVSWCVFKIINIFSNEISFRCGMTEKFYYKRTEEYKDVLNRKNVGCFNVPMIHSAVLINLRKFSSDKLTYDPQKIEDYNGPMDDIIAFAVSANKSGIILRSMKTNSQLTLLYICSLLKFQASLCIFAMTKITVSLRCRWI